MNDAGDVIVVGGPGARVYSWNGTSWSYSSINGSSFSINSVGDRIASGTNNHTVNGDPYGGRVRVYERDSSGYLLQLGPDIEGSFWNGWFGTTVDMFSVGDKVAAGGNEGIFIFEYRFVSYSEYLSDPTIIVGANNGWNTNPNHFYWVMINQPATGGFGLGSSCNGMACRTFAFNDAGDKYVYGSPFTTYGNGSGAVGVRQWNGTQWQSPSGTINGENSGDQFGYSISINSVGDRIAVGAPYNNGNGTEAGHVRIFEMDSSGAYVQVLNDIDGEDQYDRSGYSVSMNSAGDLVAIGSPYNDEITNYSGQVRVYAYGNSNGCVVNTSVVHTPPILTAINYTYATYQWLDCDNNYAALSGENSHVLNALNNGNYSVEITYSNGCVDTSSCYLVGNIADTCGVTFFDTLITQVFDTLTSYDTLTTQVFDTLTSYDTLTTQVFDTLTTQVFDTLTTQVFDTLTTQVFDTLTTQVYDTLTTQVFDTLTTNITIYDTLTTYDTVFLSVTDTLYIDVNLTGIPSIINTIKVYPNPTADQVIIDNGNFTAMSSGGYIINILNSTGQQVFSSPVNQQTFIIDISQFGSNGLYYIQILNANLGVVEVKHIILH